MATNPDEARSEKWARRKQQLLEVVGFIALVIAGWIVATPLGLTVLGVGLILGANQPAHKKTEKSK